MAPKLRLPADWEDLLKLLTSRGVEFVVTGGVAFSFHARARFTDDLDLVIRPNPPNIAKFIQAFAEFGFELQASAADRLREGKKLIRVGVEPNQVDVMNFFEGVSLDELFAARVFVTVGQNSIPLVSRAHLIANKRAIGRLQDLADADDLEKLRPDDQP